MRTQSWLHVLAAGFVLTGAIACGDDTPEPVDMGVPDMGTPDMGGPMATLVSIAVDPDPVELEVGGSVALTVTGTFDDASTSDQTSNATFESSDSTVATVGPTGTVTGAAEGMATLTVDVDGISATVNVTVDPMMMTGPLSIPMTVDDHFAGRAGFGPDGPPLHTEDDMCPMRAGGENGTCHRFTWDGTGGAFTGAFWIDGTGFDDLNGIEVASGATEVTFWAWGDSGGEVIEFGAGLNNPDLGEAGGTRRFITLSDAPAQYTVSLEGLGDYTEVRGAFLLAIASESNPEGATVYVDDIQWTTGNSPTEVALPMTVDAEFSGRAGFGPDGPPLHTEDAMCPSRAGGMNGDCHRFTWDGTGGGFTGAFWVNGTGFDDLSGKAVEAGATEISFWAWGASGGEVIEFGAGLGNPGLGEEVAVRSFITLTTTPTQYFVRLADFGDYERVFGAFLVSIATGGNPTGATFYVDDIQWTVDNAPTGLPLPMIVDDNFPDRSGFGPAGPPLHTEDNMCPSRAGDQDGLCHRFVWDGTGGDFTGTFWTIGESFTNLMSELVAPGATAVTFWAWGENGGEVLEAGAGLNNPGLGEPVGVREFFTLSTEPTQYFVPLDAFGNYTQVYGPFIIALAVGGNPSGATVYVDDIKWSDAALPQDLRPDPEDRVVSWDGGNITLRDAAVGGATVGDAEGGTVYVIPFTLPSLPAGGFTTANLNVNVLSTGGAQTNPLNADLYGLPFRTAAAAAADGVVLTTMFHADSAPDANATLIADDFLTPTTGNGVSVDTDGTADQALVDYLNAQVAAGAVAGDYVYLRLSPDAPAPIGAATTWVVSSAVDANAPPERPTLTVR